MNFREYLLVKIAEECAEVGQRASKALCFGLSEKQPGQDANNQDRLFDELDDLALIVEMLRANMGMAARLWPTPKQLKVFKYMDYSMELGFLEQAFERANGEQVCPHCQETYYEHPRGGPTGAEGVQFLRRLCD